MSNTMAKHSFIKIVFLFSFISICCISEAQTFLTASLNTPGSAGILAENCGGPYELVLRRGPDNPSATTIFISGTGTATIGVDYQFPGGSFPADLDVNDTMLVIPITVINDGLVEGLETIKLEIAFTAGLESGFITFETAIVDAYDVTIEGTSDTIVWCRNVPYVLQASSDAEEIFWSPAEFFEDSLGTAATVKPFESGWYYASVGSETCGAKDSVYFDLAIVDIANDDTVYVCIDSIGVLLQGSIEGLATDFVWIPSDSTLSDTNILTPIATPTITTTYILQSDIDVCTATDRVVVVVDSLPKDLHIDIAPEKPYYCAGEVVALFSPSFDTLSFPDLTFMWRPDPTFTSDLTLLNAALILQDTTIYLRENINNACRSRDSIKVDVVPPSVPLSVNDTTLCPGEMFVVEVLSDQVVDPEWMPEEGLSCTKCLSPKVTVLGAPGSSMTYTFSGKINECPVGASLTYHVPPLQEINIAGDNFVCDGEMIPLTITNAAGLSGFNWDVITDNASLSCDDCPNPVVTINGNTAVIIVVTSNTADPAFCGAIGIDTLFPGTQVQVTPAAFETCPGETVTVTVADPDFTNIMWTVLSGELTLSCDDCPNPEVTVNTPGRLHYSAEVPGTDTCKVTGIVEVDTFPRDVVNYLVEPAQPIGQGSEVTVTFAFSPLPSSIMWTVNGSPVAGSTNILEFIASEEVNFIEVTYINSKGCEQTDTLSVPTVPPSYKIPNAFTPNGDEKNDKFRIIVNGNIEMLELLVFNRWGQLVYEAPGNDFSGWDGQFKDVPAASDTYVYTARFRFPDGRTEIAKGDIMLLR